MKKTLKIIYIVLATIIVGGLLLSAYGYAFDADKYWLIAIVTLLHLFWWMAFLILLILSAVFINKKMFFFIIPAVLLCWPALSKSIAINFGKKQQFISTEIDVLSYNLQMFGLYQYAKTDDKRNAIINFLKNANADIYCLQDFFTKQHFIESGQGILDNYYFHYQTGLVNNKGYGYGLATFSIFPVVKYGKWNLGNTKSAYYALYTDVKIKKDTLRIVNFHLASNRLDPNDISVIFDADREGVKKTVGWIKKLKSGFKNRAKQIKILKQKLNNSPHLLIVCGDLNAVPVSSAYTILSNNLQDAFLAVGNGFGFTYNGRIPGLRIDYILCSKNLAIRRFKLHKKSKTDHFPLSVKVGLP